MALVVRAELFIVSSCQKKSKENRATPRRQDFLFYAIEINNLINLSASTTTLKN